MSHVPQSYLSSSADAAWGTMMALYWRGLTGEGQRVEVSIQMSVETCVPVSQVQYQLTGSPYLSLDNKYSVFPRRPDALPFIWALKDGYVHYYFLTGKFGEHMNKPLIDWIASEGMASDYLKHIDWNKFEWDSVPKADIEHLRELIGRFFKTKTKAEIVREGQQRRIMMQPISSIKDVAEHPQLQYRRYWEELEYPEVNASIRHPGGYCKPSDTVCKNWRRAPLIGEHNPEIYREIGIADADLANLKGIWNSINYNHPGGKFD